MSITRVEFVGFTVAGPSQKNFSFYKPADWGRWTVDVEGQFVVFEGDDGRAGRRKVEVPRALCVVHYSAAPAPAVEVRRGPGRPPKPREPEAA